MRRIIVAVDPSGTKGDDGGDHIGIVVVGLGLADGLAYVLEDASVKAPPHIWGRVVLRSDLPDCYMGSAVANATTGWERYKAKVTNRGSGGSHRPRARPQERGLRATNRDWK